MSTEKIINSLREKAPINPHEGLLLDAADKIEQLQKMIDDMTNDHYVDTLDFYFERCQKLEEDFKKLVVKSEDICTYCRYYFECKAKKCSKCAESKEIYNNRCGCLKYDNGCVENNHVGFKWKGDK